MMMLADHPLYALLSADTDAIAADLLHRNSLRSLAEAVQVLATSGGADVVVIMRDPVTGEVLFIDDGGGRVQRVAWPPGNEDWFLVVTGADCSLAVCGRPADDGDDSFDVICSVHPQLALSAARVLLDTLAPALEDPPALDDAGASPSTGGDQLVRMLLRQLDGAERRASDTSAQIIEAVERDRARIARWLHDAPVQEMTAAMLFLDGVMHLDSVDPGLLKRGVQSLEAAAASCRHLMDRLAPAMVDPGELHMRIERWLPRVADPDKVNIVVEVPSELERSHSGLLLDVVRCIDKLIENVVRHAQGRLTSVAVVADDAAITLTVADRGAGGTPATITPGPSGLGLLSRRVRNRGGRVTVDSGPDGTTVQALLPLPSR